MWWYQAWRCGMYVYVLIGCLYVIEGDNGSLWFWDWKSGHNFQQAQTIVQPGIYRIHPILFIHSFTIILFIAVRLLLKMGKISNVEWLSVSGSLDSEAGIYALSYDVTGSRLVTCEADKTIKMWREDETATPETHPLNFKPPKDIRRF